MRLYIARHGDAMSKSENPERPLSVAGRAEIKKMAQFMAREKESLGQVLHSGKARALETAAIYADIVGKGVPIDEVGGLQPNDDPSLMAGMVKSFEMDTMLTGHLPHLARLAQLLTAGSANQPVIIMETGAVICLERDDVDENWEISWMMDPGMLDL